MENITKDVIGLLSKVLNEDGYEPIVINEVTCKKESQSRATANTSTSNHGQVS